MILLRHGQSHFNVIYSETRVDPGIEDPTLTAAGEQQAAKAGGRLRGFALSRIVASPYQRTLETAKIIAEDLDLPVSIEPLVREHAVFSCDVGTPASRLRQQWPGFDFTDLPEVWWPQEDETEAGVLERCERFRESSAQMPDWSDILVVSHWGFIRGLTGAELANGAMLRFDPLNAKSSAVVDLPRSC